MRHDLSPSKHLALLIEAFRGTKRARDDHSRTIRSPISVESGLGALRARWPELRSSNQSAPIFIFAAGWRSGSTFLQRWVMTNECVLLWGEPYSHAGILQSLAEQLIAFTQSWPREDFFASTHRGTEDLSKEWIANLYPPLVDYMEASIGYLEGLFLKPALAYGRGRWGLKEVRLGINHALYLQWLFPRAKFIFLIRDPYAAYGSYRKWGNLYRTWPDEPVFTATRFGALWKELATDFATNHDKVGGLLLRYEDLRTPVTRSRLENYLDLSLADAASLARVAGTGTSQRHQGQTHWVPRLEALLLKRQVESVRQELGYGPQRV